MSEQPRPPQDVIDELNSFATETKTSMDEMKTRFYDILNEPYLASLEVNERCRQASKILLAQIAEKYAYTSGTFEFKVCDKTSIKEFEKEEFQNLEMGRFDYQTDVVEGKNWKMMLGDSCETLKTVDDNSVHLSVFSPPFQSLYTYSPTERDIGNSKSVDEFFSHFNFIIRELLRITVPGRNCCVHVAQVPAMLVRDGYIGLKDMRGDTIKAFEDQGWVFHGDITIDKDPQAQAIRTHSKALLFTQLKKDASWLRPALADYILVFRKPGDNPVPVRPDLTNNEWIEWARPIWYGIKETDTLNFKEARQNEDERHICPLQLGTIHRCIRLWSNEGETVCSPFAGVGSEGYEALRLGRQFVGCELKKSYFDVAVKNLQAVEGYGQQGLFEVTA